MSGLSDRSVRAAAGRRLTRFGLAAVAVAAVTVLLYACSVHSAPGNSDGATVVLEGKSLLGGNLTLDHWALSLDSFWLVDVLVYALAVGLVGLGPDLLHLVPSVVAAVVVVLGAVLAGRGRTTRTGRVAAGGAVVVLLALPTHAFAEFFLMGPLHVTTTLWCLCAAVALAPGRGRWRIALGVALLAAGMLGDLQAAALGVAPIAAAGLLSSLRTRSIRRGSVQVLAAAGSVVAALVIRAAARVVGTFAIAPANPHAGLHQLVVNLRHVVTWGAALAGVGYHPFGSETVPPLLEVAHGVGLALGVAGVLVACWSIASGVVTGGDRRLGASGDDAGALAERFLDDYLVLAFAGGCLVFAWLSYDSSGAFGRYLTSAVIFAALLGGRLAGRLGDRVASRARPRPVLAAVGLLLAAVVAGYSATVADTLSVPPPAQSATELASYLAAHHLDHGLGDYWSASIVTVESSGSVVVRPVIALPGGLELARYLRQTSADWYGRPFNFLVYDAAAPWGDVDFASAVATFGRPAAIERVGPYRVLVWHRPLRILASGAYLAQAPGAHRLR